MSGRRSFAAAKHAVSRKSSATENNKRSSSQYGNTDRTTTNGEADMAGREKEAKKFCLATADSRLCQPLQSLCERLRRVGSQLGPSVDPDAASRDRETQRRPRENTVEERGVSVIQSRRGLSIHTPLYLLRLATQIRPCMQQGSLALFIVCDLETRGDLLQPLQTMAQILVA